MSNDTLPPIEGEAERLNVDFEDLANEAAADAPQAGAEPIEQGPPPIDPREVAFMASLLGAVGKMFAPRWLRIIQQGDEKARAHGVDTPGGIVMLSEAIIPVANKYFPDMSNSPLANLAITAALVLGPCWGEPLRDPPPKKKEEPTAPPA